MTCSWVVARWTDTKHLSRRVTGTDLQPLRLCDHQRLEEKSGRFNMQEGCKTGQRKAAFPLREPPGPGSVLLPSLPNPHHPWAGQVGPSWHPSTSCCLSWEESCSQPLPCFTRQVTLSPHDYSTVLRSPTVMLLCQPWVIEMNARVLFTGRT